MLGCQIGTVRTASRWWTVEARRGVLRFCLGWGLREFGASNALPMCGTKFRIEGDICGWYYTEGNGGGEGGRQGSVGLEREISIIKLSIIT